MHKLIAVAALVVTPVILGAQAAPPPPPPTKAAMSHDAHHAGTGWKELDAFHELMAAAWHPAKDSANLKPARDKAPHLVVAAKALADSKAPESCNTKPVNDAVKGVAADARAFEDLIVRQANDATLKNALKLLHDKFEIANGACGKKHH
jgi:hypothetical protein